eukprot:TRINITY_DN4181_c0_g1_i1.p1 TRINITY_DN4181_c0_g1~~TRINITY_DN4181_c0_g1_i1.p1  ORF type:complete len:102 (+),score=36.82 TRINITY_DN4181_c0_g1_i1:111-416(+)
MCIRDRVKARTATQKDIDDLKKKQQRQVTIQRPSSSLDSLIASADQVGERAGASKLDYSKRSMYPPGHGSSCLLYTSDAADDLLCGDLGGRRIIKKKKNYY